MANRSRTKTRRRPRQPLNDERVFKAAIHVADVEGLKAVTMRRLAEELGVEAMSLYYHVPNKEAVLDGMADALVREMLNAATELGGPDPEADWQGAMRARILAARSVMMQHKWAPQVFEARTQVSSTVMIYFNDLLGIMRAGGFSYDLAHHAMHALGSRSLGFTQELFEPEEGEEPGPEEEADLMEQMAETVPYLVQMMVEITHDDPEDTLGWCDDETEFKFGLDLILDGLARKLANA